MNDPTIVYIAPTNACNYKCKICARSKAMRKDVGFMDMGLFKKIVDELPEGVQQVYLHKQGESTLHPDLPEMMRYIKGKRPDIKLKLNTNGSGLTSTLIASMVKYIDIITVSMWSVRPATYYELHGKDSLNSVMSKLRELLFLRGTRKTEIWIDYVRQEGNKDESEEEVINFFKSNGCKDITIAFYWAFNFLGFGEEGNVEINNRLNSIEFPLCIYPWNSMTITWDGKVSYCFVEPCEDVSLGDLNTESFTDVWNGRKYNLFRNLLKWKEFDELDKQGIFCKYCTFIWSSQAQTVHKDEAHCVFENEELLEKYLNQEGRSLMDFNPRYIQI